MLASFLLVPPKVFFSNPVVKSLEKLSDLDIKIIRPRQILLFYLLLSVEGGTTPHILR